MKKIFISLGIVAFLALLISCNNLSPRMTQNHKNLPKGAHKAVSCDQPNVICTAMEFYKDIYADPAGTYTLGSNIDLSTLGSNFKLPHHQKDLGQSLRGVSFLGTLHGNDYTIKGITITADPNIKENFDFGELFDSLGDATHAVTIDNLTLDNFTVDATPNTTAENINVGILAGSLYNKNSILNNITVLKSNIVKGNDYNNSNVGSLVGTMPDGGTIEDSTNSGSVSGSGSSDDVGGFIGAMHNATIMDSTNTGSVSGNVDVGGLVGEIISNGTIENSTNTGSVSGSGGANKGGLVGEIQNGTILYSKNFGNVTGNSYAGGLVGWMHNGNIMYSKNSGNVSSNNNNFDSYAGGLVGAIESGVLENSINSGIVSSALFAGGLVGVMGTGALENNLNLSSVEGNLAHGGIVGKVDTASFTLKNNMWDNYLSSGSAVGDNESGQSIDPTNSSFSEAALYKQSTYNNLTFDSTHWAIDEGFSLPYITGTFHIQKGLSKDATISAVPNLVPAKFSSIVYKIYIEKDGKWDKNPLQTQTLNSSAMCTFKNLVINNKYLVRAFAYDSQNRLLNSSFFIINYLS